MQLSKKAHALLMYLTVPISGFTVDIIITSLPSIKSHFNIDTHLAQYVFTFCLLGFALGQFLAGFVVDALERKKVLTTGIIILSILLGLSIYTESIYFLIFIRLLQGITISFIAVAARAVIRDIHTDEEYKNAVNYLTIGFAFALTCSPLFGSLILEYYSYKMVLAFLLFYVAVILCFLFFTEETNPNKKELTVNTAKSDLSELFADPIFIRSIIICGCFHCVIPIFDTLGSFLVTDVYGYSALQFGWAEVLLALFWLIGNLINRFLNKTSLSSKTIVSLIIALATIIFGLTYVLFFKDSHIILLTTLSIVVAAIAVLFPLHIGAALINHKERAGVANAILFSGTWLFTAIITNAATLLSSDTSISIYSLIILVLTIALSTYILKQKYTEKQ